MLLSLEQQRVVREAAADVCAYWKLMLHAVHAGAEHLHGVIGAPAFSPERVMTLLKARATRFLRERGLVRADERVWARHGSTRYLMTETSVLRACEYVRNQGRSVTLHLDGVP
jgi:REP element-mobilizing transposase RayT